MTDNSRCIQLLEENAALRDRLTEACERDLRNINECAERTKELSASREMLAYEKSERTREANLKAEARAEVERLKHEREFSQREHESLCPAFSQMGSLQARISELEAPDHDRCNAGFRSRIKTLEGRIEDEGRRAGINFEDYEVKKEQCADLRMAVGAFQSWVISVEKLLKANGVDGVDAVILTAQAALKVRSV